jgi:hypothetical protein
MATGYCRSLTHDPLLDTNRPSAREWLLKFTKPSMNFFHISIYIFKWASEVAELERGYNDGYGRFWVAIESKKLYNAPQGRIQPSWLTFWS